MKSLSSLTVALTPLLVDSFRIEVEKNSYAEHAIDYTGEIYVGNPAKKFKVLFDTGSGEFILPSSRCKTKNCKKHPLWEKTKSSEDLNMVSDIATEDDAGSDMVGVADRSSDKKGKRPTVDKFSAAYMDSITVDGDSESFLHVGRFLATIPDNKKEQDYSDSEKDIQNLMTGLIDMNATSRSEEKEQSYTKTTNGKNNLIQKRRIENYVHISYGSGSLVGDFGSDRVCFGEDQNCVENVHLIRVVNESNILPESSERWGAVMGLSLPDIGFGDRESFLLDWWQQQKKEHLLPLFSVYLGPDSVHAKSFLEFGTLPKLKKQLLKESGNIEALLLPNAIELKTDIEAQSLEDLMANVDDVEESANDGGTNQVDKDIQNVSSNLINTNSYVNGMSKNVDSILKSVMKESAEVVEESGSFLQKKGKKTKHPLRRHYPIVWAPVTKIGYWQFHFEDITIGGKPLNLGCDCPNCCQAAVDTGSSVMTAPPDMVALLTKELNFNPDCNTDTDEELPSLGFVVRVNDEQNVEIDGEGKMVPSAGPKASRSPSTPKTRVLELKPTDYMDRVRDTDKKKDACWLHIMPGFDSGRGPLFLLGMPFLRRWTTVFQFLQEDQQSKSKKADEDHESSEKSPAHPESQIDKLRKEIYSTSQTARLGFIQSDHIDFEDNSEKEMIDLKGCRYDCAPQEAKKEESTTDESISES